MKISAAAWHKHINALSKIDRTAGEKMRRFLDSQKLNYSDPKDIEYIVKYAYSLSEKYGEAVAELSCQMYDMIARSQKANVPAAEPAETATYAETEAAIRGSLKQSPSGQKIAGTVERLVKQAGADTKLKNAKRDGAYFAWVPHGDTCPFCLALAALGWQKAGKKTFKNHAEHIHEHCDCEYCIDFNGEMTVEGYDPDEYLEQVRKMSGDDTLEYDDLIKMAGHNAKGRQDYSTLNAIRRKQYKANKDAINLQKSVAYARRRGLNEKDVDDYRVFKYTGGSLSEWNAINKIGAGSVSMEGDSGEWKDTVGRELTKREKEKVIEYAKERGIKIFRISKFDGDTELFNKQIDTLSGYSSYFPRVFKGKRPTVAFTDTMGDTTFAETYLNTITYNRNIFRDRAITEKNMRDSGIFVNNTVEGITRHEFGHVVEFTYGVHGLEFAKKAYYNLFKEDCDNNTIIEYLRNNFSYYTVPKIFSEIEGSAEIDFKEITAEMFSYKGNNQFANEFIELWRKKGLV